MDSPFRGLPVEPTAKNGGRVKVLIHTVLLLSGAQLQSLRVNASTESRLLKLLIRVCLFCVVVNLCPHYTTNSRPSHDSSKGLLWNDTVREWSFITGRGRGWEMFLRGPRFDL